MISGQVGLQGTSERHIRSVLALPWRERSVSVPGFAYRNYLDRYILIHLGLDDCSQVFAKRVVNSTICGDMNDDEITHGGTPREH
jgi:hypothetical protein